MAANGVRSPNPAIREVIRGVHDARDEQILKVVAMVDAMPNRGNADQILAPLRDRLARLRPPRPLRFARLLFMPLDPLIVPAARWRPAQPAIPRTVILPFSSMVQQCLGPLAQRISAMIDGRLVSDHAVVEAAGALLWNDAGLQMLDATSVPGWETTGLDHRVQRPLVRRTGALLTQALRLRRLVTDAAEGLVPPDAAIVQAMLVDTARLEPETQPMLIGLLLARVPETGPVLAAVAAALGQRGDAALRHAGEQAAELLLDQLETPGGAEGQLGGQDLSEAGATVRRLTSLLGALEGDPLAPGRRDRLKGLRDRIDASCQSLFNERLSSDLLDPLRTLNASAGADSEWALEGAARGLRALETEARRVGGAKSYDSMLSKAADMVRAVTAQGSLGRTGGARLMEILAGPEMAMTLIRAEG